jgi:F0F1-type ATP synthase assembly protein I
MSDDPNESPKLTKSQKVVRDMAQQSGLAMELPFTIVGAILFAGFLGFLADKWLHTSPWLLIVGGALGFLSSIMEITRRYRPK